MNKLLSVTNVLDYTIYRYDSLETTMELSKTAKANDVIFTTNQTNGIAKGDRKWENKEGNLYFSFSVDASKIKDAHKLVFLAGIAMLKAIKNKTGLTNLNVKWVNDILVGGKKMVGILLKKDFKSNLVVIGIGVNFNLHPQNTIYPATCLEAEGITNLTPQELLEEFLKVFYYKLPVLIDGFGKIRQEWLSLSYRLGEKIKINLENKIQDAIFNGIDEEGNLLVTMNGEEKSIYSCDVFDVK